MLQRYIYDYTKDFKERIQYDIWFVRFDYDCIKMTDNILFYREIEKMYIIPEQLIREFRKVSSKNRSPYNGRHVETLAYLIGYQSEGNLIGTDLVFPKQSASSSHVEDRGKYCCLNKFEF